VEALAGTEAIESRLRAALATLPADARSAVLARVVEERDYGEIAASLRCSEMVVRKRVSRGLQALRSELGEAP
jgi:RNA polymerase sigma-70 factor (ECF subfamily)